MLEDKYSETHFPERGRKLNGNSPDLELFLRLWNSFPRKGTETIDATSWKPYEQFSETHFPERGRKRFPVIQWFSSVQKPLKLISPKGDGNTIGFLRGVLSFWTYSTSETHFPERGRKRGMPGRQIIIVLQTFSETHFPERGRKPWDAPGVNR